MACDSFELRKLVKCVKSSALFQEKLRALQLPSGLELVIEPWPYGAPDKEDKDTILPGPLLCARRS